MSNVRSGFHTFAAEEVVNNILYRRASMYYFLGKIEPWEDNIVPEIPAGEYGDVEARNNLLYMRRTAPSEASLVTKNNVWESGTVYDQWDNTIDMAEKPFYVLTGASEDDDFNVYKCLNNKNGVPSTVKPTGVSLFPFTTADGYIWKYMYNVPSFKRIKFLSPEFLPVQKALTDGFYNKGAIEQVSITNGGSGYSDDQLSSIVITGGGGSGASIIPIISQVTGSIVGTRIVSGGSGFTSAPTLTVIPTDAGSGIYGNPQAVLKAIVFEGSIVKVTIEDPGQNYPVGSDTVIVVTGDGTDASFSPVVIGGTITDVIVDNPGQNYSFIGLQVVSISGDGSGAQLTGVITASDFLSDQPLVEQNAVPGAIYAIKITNPGDNYTSNTTVTILGDGTGATAVPVRNPDNSLARIDVTNYGSGYTWAEVVIYDPNRDVPNSYTNAEAYAILPPDGGHGADAVKELFGGTVCIHTQIKDDLELMLLEQDYRQYGIIANPTILLNNKRATDNTYFVTFEVEFNNVSGVSVDDMIICNNKRYRVVYLDGTIATLQQLSYLYTSINIDDIFYKEATPTIQYTVLGVNEVPVINKYSGDLLYVSNLQPFIPSEEQLIILKTYITL